MTADGILFSTDFLQYSYLGLDMAAVVDYVTADVQLDRTYSHEGKRQYKSYTSQGAGVYPGWDRFGRVQRQSWIDGSTDVHGTSIVVPNRPPFVETTYKYDAASNRMDAVDARPGASWATRDRVYTYDKLDRLTKAERGVGSYGGSFTPGPRGQQWVLDMLGNWTSVATDTSGNGEFDDSQEVEDRTHNAANELTERSVSGQVGGPKALHYDAAGNMKDQRPGTSTAKLLYTHDAWNRLVKVQNDNGLVPPTVTDVGVYVYNGLHWRILKDADTQGAAGLDQRRAMWYSASWQLLQEDVDDYTNGGSPNGVDRVEQELWGLRYIDDPVCRRIDGNHSGYYDDDVTDRTFFHLTDVQFSTVAMVKDDSSVVERVQYSAYGEARFRWAGDIDNDGDCDSADAAVITALAAAHSGAGTGIADGGYVVEADLNRDGIISATSGDTGIFASDWLGKGTVATGMVSDHSSSDNVFGYDGYAFNGEIKSYYVRTRWYDPVLGRWLERDPAEYIDGANLFEYVSSRPLQLSDWMGCTGDDANTTKGAASCKDPPCDGSLDTMTYTAVPNTFRERFGLPRNTRDVKTLNALIADITAELKKNGKCCLKELQIDAHNGNPGIVEMTTDLSITEEYIDAVSNPDSTAHKGTIAYYKKQQEKLKQLNDLLCPGGTIRFTQCDSGSGPKGERLKAFLKSTFDGRDVVVYDHSCRWFAGYPMDAGKLFWRWYDIGRKKKKDKHVVQSVTP